MLAFLKENLIDKKCSVALEETVIYRLDRVIYPYLYKDNYEKGLIFMCNHSKDLKRFVVLGLAISFIFTKSDVSAQPLMAAANLNELDSKGSMLLKLAMKLTNWAILIACGLECSKLIANGQTKEIPKCVMKYLSAYAMIKILPWGMDIIDGVFN
jgi:hypothetical protein